MWPGRPVVTVIATAVLRFFHQLYFLAKAISSPNLVFSSSSWRDTRVAQEKHRFNGRVQPGPKYCPRRGPFNY